MSQLHLSRRVELVAGRLICNSGRERDTAGGDAAVVWVAVEHRGMEP